MTATAQLTLEEFLARPETKPASEYACGEVIRKPIPTTAHGRLQLFFGMLIFQFLARHPLGIVATEWRCIFGPPGRKRTYVPDVMYASFERYPRGDTREQQYLLTAPDLAIEILSPGQKARPFASKIRFYLRHGVRMVWVVDPRAESITVYTPDDDETILRAGDTLAGGDVLPGFRVPVADVLAQIHV